MIEAADIANIFCEEIDAHLQHPKCANFFMAPEQVYEKIEEICERAYVATDGHEGMEFNEALLWDIIALIKRNDPHLLQDDHSISKKAKDCTICQRRPGQVTHLTHLLCPECQQMVLELEGTDASPITKLRCHYCHSTEDLVAHLDVIHCPSCLHQIKQITK